MEDKHFDRLIDLAQQNKHSEKDLLDYAILDALLRQEVEDAKYGNNLLPPK